MNIFVYSDESGVFDVVHNKIYVFGGLVFLSKEDKDVETRKYISVENQIKNSEGLSSNIEAKANLLSNKSKNKIFRSLNNCEKFGVVIKQEDVHSNIFTSKYHKQRFLDFAYKLAIKRKLESLIRKGKINPQTVDNIYFYVDEHTIATDGKYTLTDSLLQEFKHGVYTASFSTFKPPIFPNLKSLKVTYCNSRKTPLVRAADIVANKLYYLSISDKLYEFHKPNFNIIKLP